MSTPRCQVTITRHALYACVVVQRDGYPPLLTTMDRDVQASSPKIAKLKRQLMHRAAEAKSDETDSCSHEWSTPWSEAASDERIYCLLCGADGDA